ncbi:Ribosome-binding factor A [Anaerolineae bacterium]|nr:Ribosome-binding factor A [Anaerolineae bacterium]
MPREFFRSDRVAAQFQRELAELLRTEVRDPALGMVTLSDVEVTRDMSLIKAYVSFLGASETPQKCVKTLNHQYAPKLRHGLSGRIRMRVMPELRFIYDDSIERGMRMEALLGSLAEQRPQEEGGPEQEP